MCLLLAPASKGKILLFFSFFVAVAIDSTTEANKAPLSSLYSLDVYGNTWVIGNFVIFHQIKVAKHVWFPCCHLVTDNGSWFILIDLRKTSRGTNDGWIALLNMLSLATWDQCCKTNFIRKVLMFIISWSVFPWHVTSISSFA